MITDINTHLLERGLDISKYQAHMCQETVCATFWLFNLSSNIVGYQTYRPNSEKGRRSGERASLMKYYNFVSKPCASRDAQIAVWGLETVHLHDNIMFLTEGIFDAVKLHALGLPAIAVLCNNPKHLKSWIKGMSKTTIAVCDNDSAGKKLASIANYAIFPNDDNDLGDMTEEEAKKLLLSDGKVSELLKGRI
tara:strand:- start:1294 stop:1872 length:579 start_codon:yes stop_codon:yes gene_type:complete